MKEKKDLGFWKLWNLSFGFFGVQIAYALQSAQVSRIFSTIGADPHDLSYFWILPPLMGMIVQPIVGACSDNTWTRLGRRLPYLLIGALVAIIVMCFLPNSGSLGLSISSAIIFGLVMLMLLDTSINMAMQPFKMLVGDFVNEKQKGLAYSIQSFICNAGSVVGYAAPFVLAWFISNTAPEGQVPPTVTWSFYLGAAIMLLCVIYTFAKVKEMPPKEYAEYHGIKPKENVEKEVKEGILKILAKAPKVFWTVGLVQFFCWAAFLYLWTYSTDAIAGAVFKAPAVEKVSGLRIDGHDYAEKYVFEGQTPIVMDGILVSNYIEANGEISKVNTVIAGNDTIYRDGELVYKYGMPMAKNGIVAPAGSTINVDGMEVDLTSDALVVPNLNLLPENAELTLAHIAGKQDGHWVLEQTTTLEPLKDLQSASVLTSTVLNTASPQYQEAGNWNGIIFAIQAIAAVIWALALSQFRNRKVAYSFSLILGAIGFLSVYFVTNQYALFASYALIGCAWAAMLAMPFTILTNALSGNHIGTYLGLFNCTICLPQIIAAICGGAILSIFPLSEIGVTNTVWMLVVSGVLLIIGACAVWNIKETYGSQTETD
ncbi:MAG: MFS transporter [Lachnospiraceae bacterium]|nr:MFS transporter [Lachnospiraceae bacterium]